MLHIGNKCICNYVFTPIHKFINVWLIFRQMIIIIIINQNLIIRPALSNLIHGASQSCETSSTTLHQNPKHAISHQNLFISESFHQTANPFQVQTQTKPQPTKPIWNIKQSWNLCAHNVRNHGLIPSSKSWSSTPNNRALFQDHCNKHENPKGSGPSWGGD